MSSAVPVDRAALLASARARLVGSLDAVLGDRYRSTGRRPPDGAGWIDVRDLDVTGRCAARFAHPEVTEWRDLSTITATRTLGRLVLHRWDGAGTPEGTLDELMRRTDDLPPWLANGIESLDRPAVAAVRASVLAWVADARTAVRFRDDLIWDGVGERVHLDGRAVRLIARWDARLGDRRSPTTLLVHGSRPADARHDELLAGFVALVVCYRSVLVPERVRFATAGTGVTRAVEITAERLDAAVDRIVELVGHAVAPDDAPTSPGTWCRWCHRLESCDDGRGAVERVVRPAPADG